MTSATKTETPTFPAGSRSFNPIKWLLDLDRAYREARQMKSTAEHHLKDMGITRREADASFHTLYSKNRWHFRAR